MPISASSSVIGQAQGSAILTPGSPGAPGGPGGGPPPTPGTGWELRVLSAADYSTVLAWVPSRMWNSNTFSRMLNSQANGTQGNGTVVLNMDDPWWTTTTLPGSHPAHYLLDAEHLWQVFQDGVLRFDWLGETITEQLVQPGEQRLVTVTGPDTSQVLTWGSAMPPGFPNQIVYKTDALTDSFSEVNTNGLYVIDTGLWNASSASGLAINPAGSAQIQAGPSGTVLGTTTWDLTNSLLSAQVTPMVSPDALNHTLNGSQLTQMYIEDTSGSGSYVMLALSGNAFYAQYKGPDGTATHVIDTAAGYSTVQSASGNYFYWQISEAGGVFYFWTSPDGQTWTQQWSHAANWNATTVGIYFAAQYTGGGEFATISSLNSDVVTSSLGGATYLNEPIMAVWLASLASAQARGTVPWVTTSMTAATDSFGNPWTDTNSVQVQNGTRLYDLLQGQAGMINADWIMNPGFQLQVGIPSPSTPNSGTVTLGYDRSSTVRFYEGGNVATKQRQRARNQIQNLIAAINSDGRTITAQNATSIAEWNQREAWIQAAAQVTQLDLLVVADAAAEENADEVLSWTLQIVPNQPGRTVFRDFNVGDWIGLERPDFSAVDAVRVVGITVSLDQDGNETHELVLVSYIQWLQQQLMYIQSKLGGAFVSATGTTAVPNNAQGSTQQAPTVFSESYGKLGLPGTTSGSPVVYNAATGQWVPAGSTDPVSGEVVQLAVPGSGTTTSVTGGGVTVASQNGPGPINANFDFPAGSSAGWGTQHMTLLVQPSSSGPAGGSAYSAYQAKLTPTQNGSGCFLTSQTGAPQVPTIGGIVQAGSYTVSGFVFLATQASMLLTVKVDWYNVHGQLLSTSSSSVGPVAASAWQQFSVGVVAPSAATQCNIFVGPTTAVTSNPLYVENCYIYNAAFGTGGPAPGSASLGSAGTTVTDGTGTVRVVTGVQSDGTVTTASFNAPPSLTPDPPALTATMLGVNVAWDGLLGGASFGTGSAPLLDFRQVEVHASTSSGFTPSSATLQGTLTKAGNVTLTQLGAGTTYYVVLVAENDSGVLSNPSTQQSATPSAVADNIPPNSISSAQLSFTLPSGTKVTFASSAPASPSTGDLWYNTSQGNALYQWTGSTWQLYQFGAGAISATAGQLGAPQVYVQGTAPSGSINAGSQWYNTANGYALSIYSGGTWVTQQFGAGAVSFTALNIGGVAVYVQGTAPSGSINAGSLWYDSSNNYKLNIYLSGTWTAYQFGTNAIAAGTVTTNLLAASAVTAAKIAAGTITASQIAAGTITSAQIASGTITAGNIAAGTITTTNLSATAAITGNQIAANTITSANISAGTITAGDLIAGILVAGIVDGTTVTGATLVADGTSGQFLIYSGIPQTGNLIGSWSGIAGTDAYGNTYPAGLSVQQGVITGLEIDSTVITNSTFQGDVLDNSSMANPAITGGFITETTIEFDQTGGVLLCYTSGTTVVTQNTPGTYTFNVPSTTTSAKVETWAGGQGGDGGKTSLGGSAGTGGSYACEPDYGLTPSSSVTYIVGQKGTGGVTGTNSHGTSGGDSLFGGVNGVHAIGGGNAILGYGPFNSIHYGGGQGGAASGNSGGSSGGNSGCPTAPGTNGTGSSGSSGAAAPAAQSNGGQGAPGGASGSNANTAASTPGGGGGGAGQGSANNSTFTYTPTWVGSYYGPDASSNANGLRSSTTLYQGVSSRGGGATSGNQRAIMEFNASTVHSNMSGLTPYAANLVITNQSTAYGTGMVVEVSYFTTTTGGTRLSSYPTGDTATHICDWFVPAGQTVTIPLGATFAAALAAQTVDSVVIGADVSANYPGVEDWQGYFDGTSVELVVQGTPSTSAKDGSAGGAGQVQITYASGQVLVAAISPQAGTDAYSNSYVAGGSFENLQLFGASAPATPPSSSVILYSTTNGSVSVKTDSSFTGQLAVSQADVTTYTNNTAGTFNNVSKAWSIPANDANVTTCYRLKVRGYASIGTAAESLGWQVVAFGTSDLVELSGSALPAGGAANVYWDVEADCCCVTTGSSGSVMLAIRVIVTITPTAFTGSSNTWAATATGNVVTANTTTSTTMAIQSEWTGGSGTSPTTKGFMSTFERLGA